MATMIDALDEIIREDMEAGVPTSLPPLDSLWNALFTNSMRVEPDRLGRDWEVIHTLRTGISGSLKWVTVTVGDIYANFDQVVAHNTEQVFPGKDEHVTPGHVQKKVTLAKAMGNILIPHDWIRMGKLNAAIVDAAAEIVQGAAENAALAEVQAWYTMSSSGHVGVVKNVAFANNNGTNDKVTFNVASGSVRNYYPGLFIDFHNPSGYARRNTSPVVVDAVRYIPDDASDTGGYGQVVAKSHPANGSSWENLSAAGVANNDWVVRRSSINTTSGATYGPWGPEYWLVNTGTIFNINVATFMQFQSIVKDVSGVLTQPLLDRYSGRFFQAYGLLNMFDTLVTSMGVTNAYTENYIGLQRFERHGRPFVIADGFELGDVPYVFQGRQMAWHITPFMPSTSDVTAASPTGGRMWGLKLRDGNIVRYVPPKLDGSRTGVKPMPADVEFAYPLGGTGGIFKAYHSRTSGTAGGTTNIDEAPFYMHRAFMPRWIPGMKLYNLQESL